METNEYNYLLEDKLNYVLLKSNDGDLTIFCLKNKTALVIEDNKVEQAIISEMLKNDFKIMPISELKNI